MSDEGEAIPSTVTFDGRVYVPVFREIDGKTTFELVTKDGNVPLVRQLVIDRLFRLESADGFILKRMEKAVSELSDRIAKLDESLTKATDRIQEDVDKLNAKVADLQAKVDSGTADPADLAALDALRARIDAIDPTKPDVLPEPEPTPTPEPPAPPDVEEVPNP